MLQFKDWFQVLSGYKVTEDSVKDQDGSTEEQSARKKLVRVFLVEEIGIHIINAKGHYTVNPKKRGSGHTSIATTALHFWKRRFGVAEEEITEPTYSNTGHVPSTHLPFTNVIDNVRLQKSEIMRRRFEEGEAQSRGKGMMLRPEQKSINLLRHLISQYTKPGEIVLDMFGGTFSTARACLTLSKPRVFYGCEKDKDCFNIAEENILQTFLKIASKQPNPYGIPNLDGIEEETNLFLDHMLVENYVRNQNELTPPPGLPQTQTFPPHIINFVSSVSVTDSMVTDCGNLCYEHWPETSRSVLESIPSNHLLACEGVAYGLGVSRSLIKHKDAAVGVFARRTILPNEVVCYFYGTLVYQDMSGMNKYTQYGTGIMSIRPKRFSRYAIELDTSVNDTNHVLKKSIYICPAPFCIGGHINDPSYRKDDEDYKSRNAKSARRANVIAKPVANYVHRSELRSYGCLEITCTQTIKPNEELYMSYGNSYVWE